MPQSHAVIHRVGRPAAGARPGSCLYHLLTCVQAPAYLQCTSAGLPSPQDRGQEENETKVLVYLNDV